MSILVSSMLAHAIQPDSCGLGLTEVTVDLNQGTHGAYEHLRDTVDWHARSGRETTFVFAQPGQVGIGVPQTPYLAEDFLRRFPAEHRISQRLIGIYEDAARKWRESRAVASIGGGLERLGLSVGAERLLKILPGETSQILLQIAGKELVTEVRSGPRFRLGFIPSFYSVEFLLDVPILLRMKEAIATELDQDCDRPLEVTVSLVHVHPGLTAPLGIEDGQAVTKISQQVATQFPYITLRTRIVAVAALVDQGDLFFVRDVVAPARQSFADYLKRCGR